MLHNIIEVIKNLPDKFYLPNFFSHTYPILIIYLPTIHFQIKTAFDVSKKQNDGILSRACLNPHLLSQMVIIQKIKSSMLTLQSFVCVCEAHLRTF